MFTTRWVKIVKLLSLKMPYQAERIIETDRPEIVSRLEMKYGKYISECTESSHSEIKILKGDEADNYTVIIEGRAINTTRPLFHLNRFLFDNPSYNDNVLALHGAAVEWEGKCYVFLASTTSGKTTLTSYLIHQGFGYLTDDCVLLDRNSYMVYPFSTPLHLRDGGLNVLKAYNALPNNLSELTEKDGICRYVYTPKNTVECSIPLGEIFFLERNEAENAVIPMSANEKLTALLKSPITAYPITAEYLRFLSSLGKNYCKRLKYCDMNFVKEVITRYATDAFI